MVLTRQWPEVSDFVERFCTLRKSENTRTCEHCTRNACNSRMSVKRVQFSHVRMFSDSRNVQKSVTRIITSGHCLVLTAIQETLISLADALATADSKGNIQSPAVIEGAPDTPSAAIANAERNPPPLPAADVNSPTSNNAFSVATSSSNSPVSTNPLRANAAEAQTGQPVVRHRRERNGVERKGQGRAAAAHVSSDMADRGDRGRDRTIKVGLVHDISSQQQSHKRTSKTWAPSSKRAATVTSTVI